MSTSEENGIALAVLEGKVNNLSARLEENTAATKELVEMWRAASRLLAFIKVAAGLVTAIAAAWLVIRAGWHDWTGL